MIAQRFSAGWQSIFDSEPLQGRHKPFSAMPKFWQSTVSIADSGFAGFVARLAQPTKPASIAL
jgi:hypothetical protein